MKRLFILLLLLPLCAAAQNTEPDYISDDDTRTMGAVWTELGATKVLPHNLSIGLDAGFRTAEWFNEANRFDVGLGLSWKPSKHWKFGVGYTFLMKYYPTETEYKKGIGTETEYKYSNADTGETEDWTKFGGAPWITKTDVYGNSTDYQYHGYNKSIKNYDYTRVTDAYWRPKHRLSFDIAYTTKFWKILRVTLRERYQVTMIPSKDVKRHRTGTKTSTKYRFREPNYDALTDDELDALTDGDATLLDKVTYDENPDAWTGTQDNPEVTTEDGELTSNKIKSSKTLHTLRSRLTLEIDKKGWKWTPYLYIETFNDFTRRMNLDKLRASIGVDYAVTKQHKINFGYVFNRENDDDGNQNIHAISIGYKYKF